MWYTNSFIHSLHCSFTFGFMILPDSAPFCSPWGVRFVFLSIFCFGFLLERPIVLIFPRWWHVRKTTHYVLRSTSLVIVLGQFSLSFLSFLNVFLPFSSNSPVLRACITVFTSLFHFLVSFGAFFCISTLFSEAPLLFGLHIFTYFPALCVHVRIHPQSFFILSHIFTCLCAFIIPIFTVAMIGNYPFHFNRSEYDPGKRGRNFHMTPSHTAEK